MTWSQLGGNVILIEFGNRKMERSLILIDLIRIKLYLTIVNLLM